MKAKASNMDLGKGIPSLEAMHILDEDDMMDAIRLLSHKRDQFINAIETKTMEVDAWYQFLGCMTTSELESVAESFPCVTNTTPEEEDLLLEYNEYATEAHAAVFVDNIKAYEMDDKTILVIFVPPPGRKYTNTMKLSLTPNDDNTYSVCYHNLPDSFPVHQFETDYLKVDIEKDKKDAVWKFITALSEYTNAYFIRYNHVSILEESKMLAFHIHRNSDCSMVSILIEMFAEKQIGASNFEFLLHYDLHEIFPKDVSCRFVDGVQTSDEVKELLEEAAINMKIRPFPDVLAGMFSEPETGKEDSGSSGSDTVIFDFH